MKTYIIETKRKEYYCGKTNNIQRRISEHKREEHPKWFSYNERKDFKVIYIFNHDFEKFIKRCGVKKLVNLLKNKDK